MVGAFEADGADNDATILLAGGTINCAGAANPGRSVAAAMAVAEDVTGDETCGVGCVVGGSGGVDEAKGGIDTSGTFDITSVGSRMGGAIAAAPSSREGGALPPDLGDGGADPEEC